MNKIIIGIVIVLVVIGAFYVLAGNKGPAVTTSSANAVSIQNFAFNPATLFVKTGETVTWTNNDAVAHTVTSDSGTLLNSEPIAPGASFSFTFTSPGTAAYHCAIHTTMKGAISVEN